MARYTCDDPELSHNFVEYSDTWSRGETVRAYKATGQEFLDVLKSKITALHLDRVDGDPITDVAQLSDEELDRIDVRVFSWFSMTWVAHLNALADLGNALGRKLFASSDTSKIATTDAPAHQRN